MARGDRKNTALLRENIHASAGNVRNEPCKWAEGGTLHLRRLANNNSEETFHDSNDARCSVERDKSF
jgi:hypothetical protein